MLNLEHNNTNITPLELSKLLLAKLDTHTVTTDQIQPIKEEICFCSKCDKMIACKFTLCNTCNKNFCKKHREAHQCETNSMISNKAKFIDGKHEFMKKLKMNKIKAGAF